MFFSMMGLIYLFQMLMGLVLAIIAAPMMIRSALMQKFSEGFNVSFIMGFLSRVWLETVLAKLFLFAIAIPMVFAGYCACIVGVYPVIAVLLFANWRLYQQLYALYLERGGEPIDFNAELADTRADTFCLHCRYDLRGTVAHGGELCPECGLSFQT